MIKKTKLILSAVLCVFLATFLFCITPKEVKAGEEDWGWNILDDGTAEITNYYGDDAEVVIPDKLYDFTVTSIGWAAFGGCDSITSIEIPGTVTDIKGNVFSGCTLLRSIKISDSVSNIPEDVFNNCTSLETIEVDKNNENYSSLDGVLYNKSQTELIRCPEGKTDIIIPESVTDISCTIAFQGCSNLVSMEILSTELDLDEFVLNLRCGSLEKIEVNKDNTNYSSLDGVLYNKEQTKLIKCPQGKTDVIIPDSVTSIGDNAFDSCRDITSIEFPSGLITIGEYAFYDCNSLSKIKIPEGVKSIAYGTFFECDGLTSIELPSTLVSIGDWAFANCFKVKSIFIPKSVTSIETCAFAMMDMSLFDLTIYGYEGSCAETYANSRNIPFVKIQNEVAYSGNTGAVIGMDEDTLFKAVFTEEELKNISGGDSIGVELIVNDITSEITNDDKKLIQDALPKSYHIKNCFDITLNSIINDESVQITKTNNVIEIILNISVEQNGQYQVIRLHDGKAELLPATVKDGKLVFSTDKFSTYAVIYNSLEENVDAGDNGIVFVVAFLMASAVIVGTMCLRKRRTV
ncbi:MAG: leucine-rich repeat domain-containing protein [Butyrivibrio sp.]